jgi:hypothetical protein
MKWLGFSEKRTVGAETRRVAESSLESDGNLTTRCSATGVFVDEMDTNISFSSLYSWAPKGEKAHCSGAHNGGRNTTVVLFEYNP